MAVCKSRQNNSPRQALVCWTILCTRVEVPSRQMITVLILATISLAMGQEDTFFAVHKACEGWFCETEHVEIITFSASATSSYKSVATIYPSSAYNVVEKLSTLSTYDPATKTYFVLVQDPASSRATLWSYSLLTNKATQATTTFGASNLNFDSKSKAILASYGGSVFLVNPTTGQKKPYFDVFSSAKNPNFVAEPVSFWIASSSTFSEVVFSNAADPDDDCYYIYIVNVATNKTTISECFPDADGDAGSSLGDYETLFIQQFSQGFFAVTYDIMGANYQFVYPQNLTSISTVLDFQVCFQQPPLTFLKDFAAMNWQVVAQPDTFTYNPVSQTLWAAVDYSSQGIN